MPLYSSSKLKCRTLSTHFIIISLRFSNSNGFNIIKPTNSFIHLFRIVEQNGINLLSQPQSFRAFAYYNLPVKRAEENKATEITMVMDEPKKLESYAYIRRLWESVLTTPQKWYDYRMNKRSCNTPDFKHIVTGEGLWIESNKIPALVKSKLNNLERDAFTPSPVEHLWEIFFIDPSKWFDNRKIKKNKKFPDFTHKDTNAGLWIDDKRVPTWVLTKLNDVQDEAFTPFPSTEELWKTFFADTSKWFDYRKYKKSNKHPDFIHKDTTNGLWIESVGTPSWVMPMLKKLPDKAFAASLSVENSWKNLFDDPSKWFDYRKIKKNIKHPDFKHRENGEALWIENITTPSWVFSRLNDMQEEAFVPFKSMEDWWKTFFADPSKWIDYRKIKKIKFPDFKHKDNGKVLWINSNTTPAWVLTKLHILEDEEFALSPSVEELWISLFTNPSKWHDYRKIKEKKNIPDFVHIDTTDGLWIEAKETPHWITPMLKKLPDNSFIPAVWVDNPWVAFFDDPSKWINIRKMKKNSKYPDFKHKDSGEALWIVDDRTPFWVFSKLNDMWAEAWMTSHSVENLWKTFFTDPMKWLDYRKTKKNKRFPDFRHKDSYDALWVADARTPAWVQPKLNDLTDVAFVTTRTVEDLWISVFVEQSKWMDFRKIKESNKLPDFVHEDTREALWIKDIKTPNWITLMLENLKSEEFSPLRPLDRLWKSLFNNPSNWFDNRKTKESSKHPDFVNKNTLEALWISDRGNPAWVLPKLKHFQAITAQNEILASYEAKWKAFFACPSRWVDNRISKINQNSPDFWHKDTKEGLWITSKWTPDWVVPSLNKLQNEV